MNEDYSTILSIISFATKLRKEKLCREEGGPADSCPIILVEDSVGEHFLMPDHFDGHPTDNIPEMLAELADGLTEKNGTMRWNWLAYVVEAYASESDKYEERGSMAEEYNNNPASDIKQVLIANIYGWKGMSGVTAITYSYGDDGMPVWEKEENAVFGKDGASQSGIIPFIFERFREFCAVEGEVAMNN